MVGLASFQGSLIIHTMWTLSILQMSGGLEMGLWIECEDHTVSVQWSPSYTPGFKATYVYVGELLCRNCQTLVHWRGKESLRYFRVLGYVCVYVGELLCQWCQTLVHWSRGESPRCSWVQGYMCVCWWTVLPKVSDIGAVLSICDWICEKGTTCTISECLFSSRHQPSKLNAGGL